MRICLSTVKINKRNFLLKMFINVCVNFVPCIKVRLTEYLLDKQTLGKNLSVNNLLI